MELIYSGAISIVTAMLVFMLQGLLKENKQLKKEREEARETQETAMAAGVTCLLRDRLIWFHSKYTEVGSISLQDYDIWMKMYHAYKDLGGNGIVEHLREDMEILKMKK